MVNSIVVKDITKKYRLYKEPIDRLKESLSLSNKIYHQDFLANNGISFNIKKGEVVGIIGKNGSGKSTLLKMITGVLTPSSGTISVNGKITAMLELGAGFNPELSGIENLYLAGSISGFTTDEMSQKIDEIREFADIGEFIYQPLKTYSSGMKARLGFAFAINSEPEILIIDEALSVGDVAFSRKCYAKIESMCEASDITVLFVSHSEGAIVKLCSRAILLHNGEKIIDGIPKDVVNQYLKMSKSNDINIKKIREDFNRISKERKVNINLINNDTSIFLPSLISKSVVELDSNGAYISDIKIINRANIKINLLNYKESYIFSYRVTFSRDVRDVFFGMFIKNKDGIRFGGKETSLSKKDFAKGESIVINWDFNNILSNGYYLINCGVVSYEYEKIILHRIFDGYIFKVNGTEKCDFTGNIDFGLNISIENI